MELLDKEMGILKSKLIKVIYIKLESSFISEKSTFQSSALLTLLKSLNESKCSIDEKLLLSRSKFLKDFVQSSIIKL